MGPFDRSEPPSSWDLTTPKPSPGRRAAPTLPPELAARFEVLGELGRGAMGIVLRARDRAANREVALKLVESSSDVSRERFRREGQVTASLHHPGIVGVHSAGEAQGVAYLAYELVEGCRTLEQVLPAEGQRRRLELVRDVARALGYAHSRGVIHRDVKPSNVLVDASGRVRVADFGLAAAQGLERLTASGIALGTPSFMAPEQIAGQREAHGPATDVWALGVVLHLALTDTLPFDGESMTELTARILAGAADPPSTISADAPRALDPVVARALRVSPSDRHPHGEAFAADLDAWLEHGDVSQATHAWQRRRRLRPVAAALGALLALGLGLAALASFLPLHDDAPPVVVPPRAPASLTLEAPLEGLETLEATVEVRGRAPDGVTSITVRAGDAVTRAGVRAGAFSLRVPLDSAVTVIEVAAEGADSARRTVRRHAAPDWARRLAPSLRPPIPLPVGVRFVDAAPGAYLNEVDGSALVWIPAGSYVTGSADPQVGQVLPPSLKEVPGFFMAKHEVTWGQWRTFCDATKRKTHKAKVDREHVPFAEGEDDPAANFVPADDHPVHSVLWKEACDYCAWAGLRLPTEVEWEVAARGGRPGEFPWGAAMPGADDPPVCNLGGDGDGFPFTAPVGRFPAGASPFGCLDMAGNVFEWTSDPFIAANGDGRDRRVFKGGTWNATIFFMKATYRDGGVVGQRSALVGFRACR